MSPIGDDAGAIYRLPQSHTARFSVADRDNPNVFDAHLCWSAGRAPCFVRPDTGG
jgi:hypothetical protein